MRAMQKSVGGRNSHADPLSFSKVGSPSHRSRIDGPSLLSVVLIAEPLGMTSNLLMPVASPKGFPYALLPICNTPLIEYVLENLINNQVDRIVVLVRANDEAVKKHIYDHTSIAVRDRLRKGYLRVEKVLPASGPISFTGVCETIKQQNVLQSGFFLMVPINTIASFSGLRLAFEKHIERAKTIPHYLATILCTSNVETLMGVLSNVLHENCCTDDYDARRLGSPNADILLGGMGMKYIGGEDREDDYDDEEDEEDEGLSSDQHFHHRSFRHEIPRVWRKHRIHAPASPKDYHTLIVYDADTKVVEHITRCEAPARRFLEDSDDDTCDSSFDEDENDDDSNPSVEDMKAAAITFGSGTTCVRMDLVLTDFLFFSTEALSSVRSGEDDVYAFLNDVLASELEGNCFGLIEFPREVGVIENITTMDSYIRANIDVCGRRFYPITRESGFTDTPLWYEVAPWCETVYLHTTSKAHFGAPSHYSTRVAAPPRCYGELNQKEGTSNSISCANVKSSSIKLSERFIGPFVVLGPRVLMPASTLHCAGVTCSSDVTIGEGCSLVGCVIMEGAQIGARCQLQYVIVGKGATIEADITLVNCIVGHQAVVSRATCDRRRLQVPRGKLGSEILEKELRLCLENLTVVPQHETEKSGKEAQNLEKGCNTLCVYHPLSENRALPTECLFVDDPPPKAESDEDNEESCAGDKRFYAIIRRCVRAAYIQPHSITAGRLELVEASSTYNCSYAELCTLVMQFLVQNLEKHTEDFSREETLQEASKVFTRWTEEFFNYLFPEDSMDLRTMVFVLEGFCQAIRDDHSHLFPLVGDLLDLLHERCSPSLCDSRGYCLVRSQALKTYAQRVRDDRSSSSDEEEEEQNVLELPASKACADYVEKTLIPRLHSKSSNYLPWLDNDSSSSDSESSSTSSDSDDDD